MSNEKNPDYLYKNVYQILSKNISDKATLIKLQTYIQQCQEENMSYKQTMNVVLNKLKI